MDNANRVAHVEKKLDFTELYPLPDYGDLIELSEFVANCNDGLFSDYDGTGYYAIPGFHSKKYAIPSQITAGVIDSNWTHVAWFNR